MEDQGDSVKQNTKKAAGYEYLLAYKLTVPIYDLTVEFVKKYISYKSRTTDQMEQAARSGMQNIPEGFKQQSLAGYIKLSGVSRGSLEELLNGPTEAEKAQGYFTSIPAGSKPNSISIVDGQALVDFNEATESGGGSCSMASRTAQITKTLLQFPTVTSVKLSINGRTQDIFQP